MADVKSTAMREPVVRIVKRDHMHPVHRILVRVIAIALALVVDALFIYFVTKLNPLDVYKVMFGGTFGNKMRFAWTLRDLSTLMMVGIALAPAFMMKFWNVGGEGQILMGAWTSAMCMVWFGNTLPSWLLFVAMLLTSVIIGGIWAFVPAFFKAHWNTNETLFTLMMNYIASAIVACTANILRGQASALGQLNKGTKAGWFPPLYDGSGSGVIHMLLKQRYAVNVFVVIALMIFMYVYLRYSKHGYEINVVGESENTARYAGINVKKVMIRTLILSGAICGLTGFLIVGGKDQTISTNTAGGRGFDAIIVAWLAKFNTFTMALISFMLVFLENGAHEIASNYSLNDFAADIISGIILFFILGCEFFINYRLVFGKSHKGVSRID